MDLLVGCIYDGENDDTVDVLDDAEWVASVAIETVSIATVTMALLGTNRFSLELKLVDRCWSIGTLCKKLQHNVIQKNTWICIAAVHYFTWKFIHLKVFHY